MIFHSAFENSYLWLPLIGFLVGLVGSLIGGGGGFFFIPILTLIFNVPAQVAVATSVAATIPICFFGSIGHYRNNNIDIKTGLIFAGAGVAGAFLGASLTSLVSATMLRVSFGIYMILLAIYLIFHNWKKRRDKANGNIEPVVSKFARIGKGSFFGFLAGTITATFGTSGANPVQAGMLALRMPIRLVMGTSLMVVMVNTASALGAHFIVGKIDLTLVYCLTAGTTVGALTGPKVLSGVKVESVEGPVVLWYSIAMIAFGILMIVGI